MNKTCTVHNAWLEHLSVGGGIFLAVACLAGAAAAWGFFWMIVKLSS